MLPYGGETELNTSLHSVPSLILGILWPLLHCVAQAGFEPMLISPASTWITGLSHHTELIYPIFHLAFVSSVLPLLSPAIPLVKKPSMTSEAYFRLRQSGSWYLACIFWARSKWISSSKNGKDPTLAWFVLSFGAQVSWPPWTVPCRL